jgi:LytS/YehU family sensor histidine kinase
MVAGFFPSVANGVAEIRSPLLPILPGGLILQITTKLDPGANIQSLINLQNEQIQRTLLYALIPVVVAFSFIVFVFYRSRRESFFKNRELDFKLRLAEGELKALRAQMSPHFIFNCLNSIHHYMHADHAHAGEYLVKFSQLIRHVLETSGQRMVPLIDEIEANRHYMELEQLRLNNSFEFNIHCNLEFQADKLQIPPMIIQPFIENSIWHGINQRGTGGCIDIHFSLFDDRHLKCDIDDNGKDHSTKSDIDLSRVVKKTSLGMLMIQERLGIINSLSGAHSRFEMVPQAEGKEGKRVSIIIPFED